MGGRGGSPSGAGAAGAARGGADTTPAAPAATPAAPTASEYPLDRPDIAAALLQGIDEILKAQGRAPGREVGIALLRDRMENEGRGFSKQDFDTALRQLSRRRQVTLEVDSNQKSLSSEIRSKGVYFGGTTQNLVSRQ